MSGDKLPIVERLERWSGGIPLVLVDTQRTRLSRDCAEAATTITELVSALENMPAIALAIGQQYGEDETGWLDCSDTIATALENTVRDILARTALSNTREQS